MGMQTIVYGRIVLYPNGGKEAREFLAAMPEDETYPWIRSSMFNEIELERPYYYGELVLSFAASYKNLDGSMRDFLIKWEAILLKLKFCSAKLHLETEYVGDYDFFWLSNEFRARGLPDRHWERTELWALGYGDRGMWGDLKATEPEPMQLPDLEYPVRLSEDTWNVLKKLENAFAGQEGFPRTWTTLEEDSSFWRRDDTWTVLTCLKAIEVLDFGNAHFSGRWIVQKKALPRYLPTAQQLLVENHLNPPEK